MMESFLPSGWTCVLLSDIAEVGAGNPAPQGKDKFSPHGTPFVRVQDMGRLSGRKVLKQTSDKVSKASSSGLKLFPKGTVLLTKSGASTLLNQRAVLGQDSYVVSHIATVSASPATSPDWLYFFLKTVDAANLAHGGNMPSLPLSRVKQISTLLPPLNEQHRIVEKIETLFARLDKGEAALRGVQKLLTRYRQSVLKAAVTGQLTADWRNQKGDYKWERATLGALADYLTSGSRGWAKFYSDCGDVFIRAQNLKYDRLDLGDIAYVALPTKSEGTRTRVNKGDLLITITGANVTKSALVDKELGTAYVSQHVALFRPAKTVNPEYLYWFVIAEAGGRKQLETYAYGAGKPGLNLQNIRDVNLLLPCLDEQNEIVKRVKESLSSQEVICRKIEVQLERSAALRQSILKDAFAGRLVPQDPSDEPASDLLARIRASREAAPKGKRTI